MRQLTEYNRAYMVKRIEEPEQRDNLLRAVLIAYLCDDSSNESGPEGDDDGDNPAEEGDPYWESLERAEERSRESWDIIWRWYCCKW
jgi:hypothetical protein